MAAGSGIDWLALLLKSPESLARQSGSSLLLGAEAAFEEPLVEGGSAALESSGPREAVAADGRSGLPDPFRQGIDAPLAAAVTPLGAKAKTSPTSGTTSSSTGTPTGTDWEEWLDQLQGDWANEVLNPGGWGSRSITVGIYTTGQINVSTSTNEKVSPLNPKTVLNIRSILAEIGRYLNVSFVVSDLSSITSGPQPLIRIFRSNMGGGNSYAYAYLPGSADYSGDIHFSERYDLEDPSNTNYFTNGRGSHGWQTIYHEIGHALGLDHSFESGTPVPYDNWNYTVMTYTFNGGEPITYMPGDLARLQKVYGARTTGFDAGNNTYRFWDIDRYEDGTYWYGAELPEGGLRFAGDAIAPYSGFTQNSLFDSGGIDTLDLSRLSAGVRVALDSVTGTGSVVYRSNYLDTAYRKNGSTGRLSSTGTFLDYGTVIEKVLGTTKDDEFYGGQAVEYFDGGSGVGGMNDSDTLFYSNISSGSVSMATSSEGYVLLSSSSGGNNLDYVKNVERFVFSDGTFALNSTASGWSWSLIA